MKSAHLFPTAWLILFCFAIWKLTSYEPKVTVTCKTEVKCECDTSELVKVRKGLNKEIAKLRNDNYWLNKERNELRLLNRSGSEDSKSDIYYIRTMDDKLILMDRIFKPEK